jgi:hypothetical protein
MTMASSKARPFQFLALVFVTISCYREPELGPGLSPRDAARAAAEARAQETTARERALGEARTVMASARDVTAYRVVSPFGGPAYREAEGRPKFNGLPVLAQAQLQRESAKQAIEILTDPASYHPVDENLSCLFDTRDILMFNSGDRNLRVAIAGCGLVYFSNQQNELTLLSKSHGEISLLLDKALGIRPSRK